MNDELDPAYDLCLSGGGFRATLFHLGVALYLNVKGQFSQVRRVFAVSGGSVLAAHLLIHSEVYADSRSERLGKSLRLILDPMVGNSFGDRVFGLARLCWGLPVFYVVFNLLESLAMGWRIASSIGAAFLLFFLLRVLVGWIEQRGRRVPSVLEPFVATSFRDRVFGLALMCWIWPLLGLALSVWLVLRNDVGLPLQTRLLISLFVGIVSLFVLRRMFRKRPITRLTRFCYRFVFGFKPSWSDLANRPIDVHLLATDLLTGRLADFSKEGLRLHDDAIGEPGKRAKSWPIADAVTASTAFPPACPPLRVELDNLRCSLTDGGVFDNLGVEAWDKNQPANDCLVSDAGGEFVESAQANTFNTTIVRNVRSSDIVMNRLAERDLSAHPATVHLSIRDRDNSSLSDCLNDVPRIRTDLNRFSLNEAIALIRHGVDRAANKLGKLTTDQNERINQLIRYGLRMRSSASLAPPAKSLSRSHVTPLWSLWWAYIPYVVLLLLTLYSVGNEPKRLVGIVWNLGQAPTFAQTTFATVQQTYSFLDDPVYADRVSLVSSRIESAGLEIAYYESSMFFGPFLESTLTVNIAPTDEAGQQECLAVLVIRGTVIPLKTVRRNDAIAMTIPHFTEFGRVLLLCPKDGQQEAATWEDEE